MADCWCCHGFGGEVIGLRLSRDRSLTLIIEMNAQAVVVLLDLNRRLWPRQSQDALDSLLGGIILFLKSLIAINPSPQSMSIALIAYTETQCVYLFNSLDNNLLTTVDAEISSAHNNSESSGFIPFETIENGIRQNLHSLLRHHAQSSAPAQTHSLLSRSLSMALCCTIFSYGSATFV